MNTQPTNTPDLSGFDEVATLFKESEVRDRLANGWDLITSYMTANPTSGALFPIYMIGRRAVFEFDSIDNPDDADRASREGWQSLGVFRRQLYEDGSGGGFAYVFRRRRKPKAA